jgi:1-aminocyclopropane-1-carboxylate deaminase
LACEQLPAGLSERAGVEVFVKRDDLLGPHLSGNKARKLLHQLPLLKGQGAGTTFGGASSTHLHTFALAGAVEGFHTIGLVRQEASEPEGLLLQQARALGMAIVCLGRDAYRRLHEQRFHSELQDRFGPFHLIPEGGTNALGIQGIAEFVQELPDAIDVICCPSAPEERQSGC